MRIADIEALLAVTEVIEWIVIGAVVLVAVCALLVMALTTKRT